MLDDFGNVKGAVQRLVSEKLDHWYLNETTELENPTSEELARWIFDWLESRVNGLHAVEIAETCTTSSMYRRPVVNA
jgi:6-pyruvoyltetrahydropterin/6-carboxytetrahydropterin synthase